MGGLAPLTDAGVTPYRGIKKLQAAGVFGPDRVGMACHGPAILPGVIDSKTGKTIIEGKTVIWLHNRGELIFRILDELRADKVVPVVEAVTAVGAYYSSSMNAFDDYSITSGRIVTGTNRQSARSAGERVVKLFDTL